jgi:hypothetical protein
MSLKPNSARGRAILIFLIFALVLDLASWISSYLQLSLLTDARSGVMITEAEATQNDMREAIIAIIMLLVRLGCIITFIMWFRRAYYNLHQKVSNLAFSEGWAAGGWFVPFLNLGRPVQIMSEMARETKELLVGEKLIEPRNTLSVLIPTWWILWLLSGITNNYVFRAQMAAKELDALISVTKADLFAGILSFVLTIITIFMVRTYAKMETLLPLVNADVAERPIINDGDLLDTHM